MDTPDFTKKFISFREIEANRYSCLVIALTDARLITGRNIDTGQYELNILTNGKNFLNPHSFIGIINYLLILDMMGEIFETPNFKTDKTSNIYKSLEQFSSLRGRDNDIDTIIALRNSLAHNYGLINIPKNQKDYSTKLHKFTIDNSENAELIKYPSPNTVWNCDFLDKSEYSSTKIGYRKVIDLIESVYGYIKNGFEDGSVILSLKDEELKARFTIRY